MRLRSLFPRGLYGRAALILIVPIVAIQFVVSITFIQRHFEGVTRQMTGGVALEIGHLVALSRASPQGMSDPSVRRMAAALLLTLDRPTTPPPAQDHRQWIDLSGREVIATLRADLPGLRAVELLEAPRRVRIWVGDAGDLTTITVPRRRMSASNPHQLLVLMIVTSVLMTLIAYYFLRLQLRPITKLAAAANAFGKGITLPYRPRGAQEVRAAGRAFLDMRARIERQIEQRTLMLSGVSHDLRTPLTRMRLALSLLPEDEDTAALIADVAQMERLVDEFLSFARSDQTEDPQPTDPAGLVQRVVQAMRRGGQTIDYTGPATAPPLPLRRMAVERALENLISNALRYGTRARVEVEDSPRHLRIVVEDDGPGIPSDRREEAVLPFTRLDAARDPNRGGGVGLGLSIAADAARAHGGALHLREGRVLPGLRAELVLAR